MRTVVPPAIKAAFHSTGADASRQETGVTLPCRLFAPKMGWLNFTSTIPRRGMSKEANSGPPGTGLAVGLVAMKSRRMLVRWRSPLALHVALLCRGGNRPRDSENSTLSAVTRRPSPGYQEGGALAGQGLKLIDLQGGGSVGRK